MTTPYFSRLKAEFSRLKASLHTPGLSIEDEVDTAPIFAAMQSETLVGVPLSDVVGGGDQKAISESLVGFLIDHELLFPDSDVLDIGCGCGRVATTLLNVLNDEGSFKGVDIVEPLVSFCDRWIARQRKSFEFYAVNTSNSSYDSYKVDLKVKRIDQLADAVEPRSIDLCIANSLFTHLSADETLAYLYQIRAALRPGGRAVLTFFLLDPTTRARMDSLPLSIDFKNGSNIDDNVFYAFPDAPMDAVGFDETYLRKLIAQAGLSVRQVFYGSWAQRRGTSLFQDWLVLEPIPEVFGYAGLRSAEHINGWAVNTTNAAETVDLTILADGRAPVHLKADVERPDIARVGYGTGHGFDWRPEPPLASGTTVRVISTEQQVELNDSPMTVP
jgi:SAM-dependent methyltransferase